MLVVSEAVSNLVDVAKEVILIAKVDVLGIEYVIVHRNHPSRDGVIVDDTMLELIPTWPVSRLKFAYTLTV
jgi:hypothetical protein